MVVIFIIIDNSTSGAVVSRLCGTLFLRNGEEIVDLETTPSDIHCARGGRQRAYAACLIWHIKMPRVVQFKFSIFSIQRKEYFHGE